VAGRVTWLGPRPTKAVARAPWPVTRPAFVHGQPRRGGIGLCESWPKSYWGAGRARHTERRVNPPNSVAGKFFVDFLGEGVYRVIANKESDYEDTANTQVEGSRVAGYFQSRRWPAV